MSTFCSIAKLNVVYDAGRLPRPLNFSYVCIHFYFLLETNTNEAIESEGHYTPNSFTSYSPVRNLALQNASAEDKNEIRRE